MLAARMAQWPSIDARGWLLHLQIDVARLYPA
jgi:hypothetical protein